MLAGCTTTFVSSETARWRAGRCRKAFHCDAASVISPFTSRITRSSTATSKGTIPAGEYGAGTVEIWDRGTYELVEEKRDGGLTVRLQGERLDGVWTLVPAKLDGDPKNWLLLRKDGATAGAEPVRAHARDLVGGASSGRRLDLRAQVGRVPRDRHDRRRPGDADEQERQRPDRALQAGGASGRAGDALGRRGARRRDLRARRQRPLPVLATPGGLRHAGPRRLRPARARLGAARRASARGAPEAAGGADRPLAGRHRPLARSSTTARRLLAAAEEQELEGVDREAPRHRATSPDGAARTGTR